MEKFKFSQEALREEPVANPEATYNALSRKKEKDPLEEFIPEEQAEISNKQQILSSLAYFIGKDFQIPVELNQPGAGWHWNLEENKIKIDPKDLLEKPMDYLRFVISHEGGHRRISRTDFIPLEEWRQPGFAFMINAIEDPRDNNFVAESYPKFREQMELAYKQDLDFEAKAKEKADQELGYMPRFMQAGFEYIKQWFRETQDQEMEISAELPDEIKAVVKATIEFARDSWWRYPSREEADNGGKMGKNKINGEEMIKKYARTSYEINRDEIWPEFKKLIEEDMEDQEMQEFLKDAQKKQGEGKEEGEGGQGLPQDLKDKLSPEEQKELEEAVKKAIEDAKKEDEGLPSEGASQSASAEALSVKPIELGSLSEELKQKIKEYIESLPEEQQKEITEKAQTAIKEFEDGLNEELQGKLSENPEEKAKREEIEKKDESAQDLKTEEESWKEQEKKYEEGAKERRKRMESFFEAGKDNPYRKALAETSDIIDGLTADLRDVFVKRKIEKYEAGYRSGRRWNVRQRIREKVAGISLFKTEAREQRVSESEEMDYAITMLIDLSGSMNNGQKIQEAFKSSVALAETLNNLGVKFEIVGFQDVLLEFKSFEENLDEPMRGKLNQMILEVSGNNPEGHNNPGDNDDGACLLEASKHLADQIAKNKFLIVLSDGIPAMDSMKKSSAQLDRELKEAVAEISANTNQKLIGIGLMSGAVAKYYENNIAGVSTKEMVETLGGLLREIIEKY